MLICPQEHCQGNVIPDGVMLGFEIFSCIQCAKPYTFLNGGLVLFRRMAKRVSPSPRRREGEIEVKAHY
jgi:hypothetical protein